jgi:hypothetical protein
MRGGFIPGLSALDTSAQIIAWAVVFGYSQQLLTHFVDVQARTVRRRSAGRRTPSSGRHGTAAAADGSNASLKRTTGFEPATFGLGSRRSTN